jgi:peroxiredoxin
MSDARRLLLAVASHASAAACGTPPAADAAATATIAAAAPAPRALAVGERLPELVVRRVTPNGTSATDSLRVGPGQPMLVALWATWCAGCREEFAALEQLHRELGPRGLRVVAISIDDGSTERVRRFVAGRHATFTVGHDASGRVAEQLRLVGVPESFVVDADGRVRWRHRGRLTFEDARTAVLPALGTADVASGVMRPE